MTIMAMNKKLNDIVDDINIDNIPLHKMNKAQLLEKCEQLNITKCKSKNKSQLMELIQNYTPNPNPNPNPNNTITTTKIQNIKPLIKWSGGKSDEIKHFIQFIPSDYDTYIEPFIGGGSVYFYLFPNKAIISDVHTELIDFYQSIREGKSNEIYEKMMFVT